MVFLAAVSGGHRRGPVLDESISRDVECRMQAPDHVQAERAPAAQNFGYTAPCSEDVPHVGWSQVMLVHEVLDDLSRTGGLGKPVL